MLDSGKISELFFIASQIVAPANKGIHSFFCCCFSNALCSSPLGKVQLRTKISGFKV